MRNSSSKHNPSIPKPKPEANNDDINLLKPNFMKKKDKNDNNIGSEDHKE